MAIPTTEDLALPMLVELSDGIERSVDELHDRLAVRFEMDAAELDRRTPSGTRVFLGRVQQARVLLIERGLVASPIGAQTRITVAGLQALAIARERGLQHASGWESVRTGPARAHAPVIGPGPLESELRRLTGPVAHEEDDWWAIRLLNGWGIRGVFGLAEVSQLTGRPVAELVELDRRCRRGRVGSAPILDAVLAFARVNPLMDANDFAFHLVQLGLVWSPLSLAGVCEAARRFGRGEQWRSLVRGAEGSRERSGVTARETRMLPRPFESWFELEVFLFLEDQGYRAEPHVRVGGYRTDLLLNEVHPRVLVECDDEEWRRGEQEPRDRATDRVLEAEGYRVVRVSYAEWAASADSARSSLREALRNPGPLSSIG